MRKLNLTLALMLIFGLFAVNSYAQNSDKNTRKTPEEKAEKMAKRMQEKLALTDAQYKSVYQMALSSINERQSWGTLDKDALKEKMKKQRENNRSQLQSILTPDQWTKWEGMRKEMKGKHKDKEGKKHKSKDKIKKKEKPVK